jgi:hypothetical protein
MVYDKGEMARAFPVLLLHSKGLGLCMYVCSIEEGCTHVGLLDRCR